MTNYILDEEHNVVAEPDIHKWGRWFEGGERRRVGSNNLHGKRVSTVFLGLDHRFGDEGPPLLFETMVFPGEEWREEFCERYCTWDEAVAGHDRAVQYVRDHADRE